VRPLYVPTCLITNLDDRLARRFSARQIGLSLLHTLSREGVFVESVDLRDTLAHDIEGLGAVGDHVAHHPRTQELDVLCKHKGRERWDSAGGISEGNQGSFPLREFEVIVQPGHGDQATVHMMTSQKETHVPFPTLSNTASTPTPFATSNTLLSVSSLVYVIHTMRSALAFVYVVSTTVSPQQTGRQFDRIL